MTQTTEVSAKPRRRTRIQRRGLDPLTGNTLQRAVKRFVIKVVLTRRAWIEKRRSGVVYNPLAAETHQNPQKTWQALRETDPIHWSDVVGGWVVSKHSDIDRILRDYRHFSNVPQATLAEHEQASALAMNQPRDLVSDIVEAEAPSMLQSDPPDHTRLRSLVAHAFTPKAVSLWQTKVESVAEELIGNIGDRTEFDFLEEYANPLPLIVIAEMVGVPHSDRDLFKAWSVAVARTLEPTITAAQAEEAAEASFELGEYFDKVIEDRRIHPQDDLITVLIQAEEEGEKLSHAEVIAALQLILIAGHETTSNLLGNGMYALLLNPNQLEWLKDNPDQSEAATEELLRFDSPVAVNARTALEDIEIDGVTVKKGQSVILLQGSGNYDHDFTSDPAELELKKGDKGHLSFGRGIHYCLGAPLARLEGQIGFGRFLSEWSDIELVEQPIYKDHIVLRGLRSLRIRVSK